MFCWFFLLLIVQRPLARAWNAPPARIARPHVTQWTSSSLKAHSETNSNDESPSPTDTKRRDILKQSSALLVGLTLGSQAANSMDSSSKIVLQTSSENAPVKYVDASATATTTPVVSKAGTTLCLDSEDRRISVFERTAPSVVFIDTFKEQRDVFSTNV